MSEPTLSPQLHTLLKTVDTPTICNAIETAQGGRGFTGFTKKTFHAADASLPAFFGYARTARIRASQPSEDKPDIVRTRRMAYYEYMAEGTVPRVAVIEDLDGEDAVGAYWGEVNSTVHKGFGIDGAITNGLMRDLGDLAPEFQVLAGGVGPSHAFVHVVDFDTSVTVFGLRIAPGDFIHADRHGAVVIPPDVLPQLPAAIATMQQAEALVLDPAREPGFDFQTFRKAWEAFEKARV